jgi:hypothetical protein
MRCAYIARLDLDADHLAGVQKKILAQKDVFERELGPTSLFHTSDTGVVCNGKLIRKFGTGRMAHRMQHMVHFHRVVASAIESSPLDFCYIRYQRSGPGFLSMLRRMRRSNPSMAIFVEMPSFPYHTEETTTRERILGGVDRVFRPHMVATVDRIVTFSRRDEILGIPTVQTDNGTDVDAVKVLPAAHGSPIRLLGLANLSFWHGYDRVIEGMALYKGNDVVFDIVGSGRELPRLKADAVRLGIEERVIFHGTLTGDGLDRVMEGAHIGISSIGMHRLDVETSNLKSREFCARGLPFVMGYPDSDFSTELPFVYHAPADDSPLDIGALLEFRTQLQNSIPEFPQKMRAYAEEKLSWGAKLAPVVEELRGGVQVSVR